MHTERHKVFVVTHPETGLSMNVFRVDCFIEVVVTEGLNYFEFFHRFYETETGLRVIAHKPKVWIVQAGKLNHYVREA